MAIDNELERIKNEIYDALTQIKDTLSTLQSQIKDKDIIIFLGNTRSGKSTLVNYILENELMAFELRPKVYKIKKQDNTEIGPTIGHGSLSKTMVPGIYDKGDCVIIDAPGFDDNRGEAQDIINAMYINQIQHSKSCKFVLVSDIVDIVNDNIGNFLKFITTVNNLMPNAEKLRSSVVLILTKDNLEYKQKEITNIIQQEIILNRDLNISKNDRELINSFAENEKLIAFFRMPTDVGKLSNEDLGNIGSALSATSGLSMTGYKVGFPVSANVRLALLIICRQFIDELNFDNALETLLADFENFHDLSNATEEQLQQAENRLKHLNAHLQPVPECINVQNVLDSLKDLIEIDTHENLHRTLSLFVMLDEEPLMDSKFEQSLIEKYLSSITNTSMKIKDLINKISNEREIKKITIKSKIFKYASTAATSAGFIAAALGESALTTGMVATASTGIGLLALAVGLGCGVTAKYLKNKISATQSQQT